MRAKRSEWSGPTCTEPDCSRPLRAKGLCNSHYESYRLGRGGNIRQAQGTLQERWEAKVRRTDDCWLWIGYCDPNGYGRMTYRGKVLLAHRVIWELICGPIPAGKRLLHTCDNPPCVRPDHLILGTQIDNITDAVVKGRQKGQ